jgi:hypothetical protein
MRYLTSSGCYAWIHSFTRDITLLRPEEYDAAVDDAAVSLYCYKDITFICTTLLVVCKDTERLVCTNLGI